MIAIIDYGMGNIHSVQKALELFKAETLVTNRPEDIPSCDKVVLPGVGAFADAMQEMEGRGIAAAVREHIRNGKVFLGICLGLQLLFPESEEAPKAKGLGILAGSVKGFPRSSGVKVPHMGWNQLKIHKRDCPLLKGIPDGSYVYFCHSYFPANNDPEVSAASTDYPFPFTSVIWKDNIYGAQFHPEKSQGTGLKMLDNFVNIC